jgi:adenine-specific DNA-methyltransferase
MDKMRMESLDMTVQNIEKIAVLFPNCVTETKGENGKLKKAVNFEMLKQMLSDDVTDGDEAYEFTWVGKKASIVEANKPIRKTLRPCPEESRDWDTTENLYIEGDNLEVLKLLQESYLGKVKMIYIDPPYNTGNDFIYRDDFSQSSDEYQEQMRMFDEETGDRLFKNTDSNGRFHSDWCSMIYSRLMLARNLLSDDGAIFISIDDNEAENLKKICDEIFGADCFVANVSWQRTYAPRNDSKGISSEIEHVLVYSKQPEWIPNKLPRTAEMNSKYGNPDNDVSEWRTDNPFAPGAVSHQGMVYAIQHPFTGEFIYPGIARCWTFGQEQALDIMSGWGEYELKDLHDEKKRAEVCGVSVDEVRANVKSIVLAVPLDVAKERAEAVYKRGQWPKYYFTKNGYGGIAKKTYLDQVGGRAPTNFWSFSETGHTDEAKKEIISLFDNNAPFDTPKPTRLMERILTIASDKNSLVLDFFSGSATMAHSVLKKNAEDDGHRRFIMIQLPERSSSAEYATLCDIGKERIRRAGDKIKTDSPLTTQDLDTGFRVLKLDDSNMNDVYYSPNDYSQGMLSMLESNVKSDRTDLDLLFGCLLEWGLPLSLPYSSEKIDGCTVHNYNDGDLIACFDENVPDSVIKEIAKRQPLRAVFRDSSFANSPSKINVGEIFKLMAPDTRVKVI